MEFATTAISRVISRVATAAAAGHALDALLPWYNSHCSLFF
jgi:hypothetical protein